ncbi:MAG: EAL domain-containing protein [Prochloraceae cyanobacterium]
MKNNLPNFNEELENIKPKKILIIDDLPDNLRLLSNTLKEQGYQVRCAKSGYMALMAVEGYKPDLILLDIKLPDIDGYQVCKQLKANEITREIPVIFLSALNDILYKTRAFAAGGVDYISKPFQIAEVLTRINHQLALVAAEAKIRHLNAFLEKKVRQRTAELQKEIIERIKAQMQAKQDREKLESILNSLQEVVLSLDFNTLEVIYLNPAVEQVWNRSPIEFFKNRNTWLDGIYPEDRQRVEKSLSFLKSQTDTDTIEIQYRIVRPGGEIRWVNDRRYLVYDDRGRAMRIDAVINDITDRKLGEKRLINYQFYDSLTGLPNRTLFVDFLSLAIKRIEDTGNYSFAVLSIDLDDFSRIENTLGKSIADRLLIAVTKVLKECLRANDALARWGGDRFMVFLEGIDRVTEATEKVDRIETALKYPFDIEGHQISIGASIGVVMSSSNYHSASELLRDGDIATKDAKQNARGSYKVFEPQMSFQDRYELSLESELQLAFDRQEFLLYYQPIISLTNNKLIAFEALLRWQHPDRGLISPSNFITIAEGSDLILPIGQWMLARACSQLSIWQKRFDSLENVSICVNLTGQQIRGNNFIDRLDLILEASDLDPQYLQLEIPETHLLDDIETNLAILREIKQRQIKLSIDRFGAGHSSLSYLHRFPIDSLKISRSFISNMDLDRKKRDIVRTLIAVTRCLGKNAIALGVDRAEQLVQLRSFGCQQAQGYFFCKPLNSTAVESIVSVSSQKPFE